MVEVMSWRVRPVSSARVVPVPMRSDECGHGVWHGEFWHIRLCADRVSNMGGG